MSVTATNTRKLFFPIDSQLELKAAGAVAADTTHGSYHVGGVDEVQVAAIVTAVTVTNAIDLIVEGGTDSGFGTAKVLAKFPITETGIFNICAVTEQNSVTYPYIRLKTDVGASDTVTYSAYLVPDSP